MAFRSNPHKGLMDGQKKIGARRTGTGTACRHSRDQHLDAAPEKNERRWCITAATASPEGRGPGMAGRLSCDCRRSPAGRCPLRRHGAWILRRNVRAGIRLSRCAIFPAEKCDCRSFHQLPDWPDFFDHFWHSLVVGFPLSGHGDCCDDAHAHRSPASGLESGDRLPYPALMGLPAAPNASWSNYCSGRRSSLQQFHPRCPVSKVLVASEGQLAATGSRAHPKGWRAQKKNFTPSSTPF